MKNKLIAWLLLACAVSTLATGCSRRDQYRDPIATTATIEMSTDETNIGETDPYAKNPSPLGTGNPYQNLDREDLKELYSQSPIAQLPMRSVYNTPYYYLFHRGETQRGGLAYSKLTGKMVPLCKELACDHSDCLFSKEIRSCIVTEDTIYLLMDGSENDDKVQLYSFNHMLDQPKLIYEGEGLSEVVLCDGVFYAPSAVWDEEGGGWTTVLYVLNLKDGTLAPAFRESFSYQINYIADGYMYYVPDDGSLWRVHLKTEEKTQLLDSSHLDRENGDIRFNPQGITDGGLLVCWKQNIIDAGDIYYYDLRQMKIVDNGLSDDQELMEWTRTEQYICMNYAVEGNEDDPNFTYYQDSYFGKRGGEIWRRDPISGDVSLVTRLTTDNIPDVIYSIEATDGKTLLISYMTYEDFDNVYNGYEQTLHGAGNDEGERFAVIDLETGTVYKNDYYQR